MSGFVSTCMIPSQIRGPRIRYRRAERGEEQTRVQCQGRSKGPGRVAERSYLGRECQKERGPGTHESSVYVIHMSRGAGVQVASRRRWRGNLPICGQKVACVVDANGGIRWVVASHGEGGGLSVSLLVIHWRHLFSSVRAICACDMLGVPL